MSRRRSHFGAAMAFLAPNFIGLLVFTVLPLVFAIVLAFTNWDLRRHNMYKGESLDFVGLANFTRLLSESDFMRYLGNTLYLMMGIPFAMAGSLASTDTTSFAPARLAYTEKPPV